MTKDCELWIQSRGTLNPDQKQFGSFLRDAPFQAGGKNAFFVPGIFDRAGKNFKKQKQRDEDEGVSPEVGLAHNVPMDKQAARVCIDDEDSFEESSVSKNKQMIESFNEETKTAINPKNSSHPKFTPPNKPGLYFNESYSLPKSGVSDFPKNLHISGDFEFEAQSTSFKDHVITN